MPAPKTETARAANGTGLKAAWWNNNSFTGDPVLTNVVTKLNPIVGDAGAPFPKTTPPLGPELVSARFTGTSTPKVSGEYKFVSNAHGYLACLELRAGSALTRGSFAVLLVCLSRSAPPRT